MSPGHRDDASPLRIDPGTVEALVGRHQVGDWVTVTQEQKELFGRSTWLDAAYPEPPVPEYVSGMVPGFLTLALLDALFTRLLRIDRDLAIGINYGFEQVRFLAPLLVDEEVRLVLVVDRVRPVAAGQVLELDCRLAKRTPGPPVLACRWLLLVRARHDIHVSDDSTTQHRTTERN